MKRAGGLLPEVASTENLRLAFWKAARGKTHRPEVVAYRSRLEENLDQLRRGLIEGTAGVGRYHFFTIYDPKERRICAADFPERVLHHALMNVCEPILERRLIHDTYACRKGKGRLRALDRAQHYARRHDWYLKMDVRKYFDSMDHDIMEGLLERIFKDKDVLRLFRRIIRSYCTGEGRGMPIGNLTSQHFANTYLGELDRQVKHELGVRGYVRYMDDFVLWGQSREEMKRLRDAVEEYLGKHLALSANPVQINRTATGMPFLGSRLFPRHLRLGRRGRRRFIHRLHKLEAGYRNGEVSSLELQSHATALVAYTDTCQARNFRISILRPQHFGAAVMDSASGSNRVLRGGNWNNNANNARVANRNNNSPGNSNNNNGFRPVRSSETAPAAGHDSDPAAVPPPAPRSGAKTNNTRPGISSGGKLPSANLPGGFFLC